MLKLNNYHLEKNHFIRPNTILNFIFALLQCTTAIVQNSIGNRPEMSKFEVEIL